jgi:hypothetical protein
MQGIAKGKCYRVEQRTVIPGPVVEVKQVGGGFNGSKALVEQCLCFVVVNGRTERYIGKNHMEVPSSSALRPGQYFTSQAEAEMCAVEYHHRNCPNPVSCGWAQL